MIEESTTLLQSSVSSLYQNFRKIVSTNDDITSDNLIAFTIELMKLVETYPNLTGSQKKNLVLIVIELFVEDEMKPGKSHDDMILFIRQFLPHIIDKLIEVDRKQLFIHAKKLCQPCFFQCTS